MKRFLKYRYTLYNILSDVIVISSVLFFHNSPMRILGFYWLDTCSMLFFFMLYWKWIGRIKSYIGVVVSSFFIIAINVIFLTIIIPIADALKYDVTGESMLQLIYPYYDVAFFLFVSAIGHYQFFLKTKELFFKGAEVELFVNMSCIYSMYLIPAVLFVSLPVLALSQNPVLAILLSFIILHDRIDYWRYKKINMYSEQILAQATKGVVSTSSPT